MARYTFCVRSARPPACQPALYTHQRQWTFRLHRQPALVDVATTITAAAAAVAKSHALRHYISRPRHFLSKTEHRCRLGNAAINLIQLLIPFFFFFLALVALIVFLFSSLTMSSSTVIICTSS